MTPLAHILLYGLLWIIDYARQVNPAVTEADITDAVAELYTRRTGKGIATSTEGDAWD